MFYIHAPFRYNRREHSMPRASSNTHDAAGQEQWLAVIARALSYLCIRTAHLRRADLGPKAALLESLGLPRSDIAALLETTPESIRVTLHIARSRRKKKPNGRNKK